jgi:hypothetical protein
MAILGKRAARFNFIARNWRGELPLWVSYWIFGWLDRMAFLLLAGVVAVWLAPGTGFGPWTLFVVTVTLWMAIALISCWQLVGVWRSANRVRETSSWAGLAKLSVVAASLLTIRTLAFSAVPQTNEVMRIAFLDDPDIPAYSMRIMRDGTELEISGGFKFGLSDDFVRIARAVPRLRVVHLDSVGGRLAEGQRLYSAIRERGLVTYVSHQCLSACTVAFAGGRERFMAPTARLGFHAATFPGVRADGTRDERNALTSAGFDKAFVARAVSTSSKGMWFPTTEELLRAHAITAVAAPGRFAASGLGGLVGPDQLIKRLRATVPAVGALEELRPTDYQAIVDQFYDGYLSGLTQAELDSALSSRLTPILRANVLLAEDQQLRGK